MFQSPMLLSQSIMRLPLDSGSHLTAFAALIRRGFSSAVRMYHAGTRRKMTSLLQRQQTG